jgi:hypothetical protein
MCRRLVEREFVDLGSEKDRLRLILGGMERRKIWMKFERNNMLRGQ